MPWLQFFDESGGLIREYELSRQAKIMMDEGGTVVLDELATDTETNPRVLMVKAPYAYAKSISDDGRKIQNTEATDFGSKYHDAPGPPPEDSPDKGPQP